MAERTRRILLADDDAHFRVIVGRLLAGHGYEVEFAPTGQDALNLAGGVEFDLVVVDVKLPGPGGIELVRQLRANGMSAPAMLASAVPVDVSKELLQELDIREVMLKPFNLATFLEKVNQLVG